MKISLISVIAFLFLGSGTKEIKLTEGIQPGYLAPGINLQGINFEGNGYVLLQFWAAYDPQSRVQNIRMHNVITQAKTDKLRLISISLDENPSVFEGVIKVDHLDESTQFIEPAGRKSEVFKAFRLKNGFNNWLINQERVIVAKNISPDEVLTLFM
jgi:hypothetical protein